MSLKLVVKKGARNRYWWSIVDGDKTLAVNAAPGYSTPEFACQAAHRIVNEEVEGLVNKEIRVYQKLTGWLASLCIVLLSGLALAIFRPWV